jgi:microcystin-dependent protein
MSDPYVGEIRMFGGTFAPVGWFFCDGQSLSIAQYDVLYVLLGTTYGGDGVQTFNLPDLRGRVPVHQGTSAGQTYVLGQMLGMPSVTLTPPQLPAHTHTMMASGADATSDVPAAGGALANGTPAGVNGLFNYIPYNGQNQVALSGASITPAGNSVPHDNMQPYLGVNFIISWAGIFPSQN